MSLLEEESNNEGPTVMSTAGDSANLLQIRSHGFKSAWDCLISRIVNKDSDGVRHWCEVWRKMPESTHVHMRKRTNPVCDAAAIGSVDIIEILVEYGFHPNCLEKDEDQLIRSVPIHEAARNGHLDVVKKLVEDFRVPVDTRNSGEWTALMWAVRSNHTSVVKYLIDKGADANNTRHGHPRICLPPLYISVMKCSTENANLLLDSGADVNFSLSNAGSVLNRAVRRGYLDMVKLLYNRGAKLDVRDRQGLGVMHLALEKRPNIDLIRYLIELNVSLDVRPASGFTPLCHGLLSTFDGDVVLVWAPLLLKAGHQLSRQDYDNVRNLIKFTSDQLEKIDGLVEEYLSVPRTLQQLCCFRIRSLLGVRLSQCIDCLPLPCILKKYIRLELLQLPALTKTREKLEQL